MHLVRPILRLLSAVAFVALTLTLVPADVSAQALSPDVLKAFKFRAIGPTRQSGRFVDFAVPEQEPRTIYAATGSGGLWKSVNNGISWEPIFDNQPVISIGDIAVAPSNPEHRLGRHRRAHLVAQHLLGRRRLQVHRRRQDLDERRPEGHAPHRPHRHRPEEPEHRLRGGARPSVLARTTSAASSRRSTAARRGRSRSTSRSTAGRSARCDLVMDPKNPKILYAATYDKERKPWTFNLGGPGSAIYKTIDAGKTWTKLDGGLPGGHARPHRPRRLRRRTRSSSTRTSRTPTSRACRTPTA